MDDASTRKTLDALADLFLTEPEVETHPARSDVQAEQAVPVTMRGTPRPMRLPPKTPVAAVLAGGDRPEAVDATPPLTLRLPRPDPGRSDGRRSARQNEADSIHLEAVLLGNLPVLGRPWLTQYAHRISQSRGPVVVLHIDPDQIEAELICTTDSPRMRDTTIGDDGPVPTDGESLAARLQSLAESQTHAPTTYLIHLPPPDSSGEQDWTLALKRWTLLCGADEAAIAAAYQLLKQMLERDPARAERRVGLAVMGSDEDASLAVAAKLNEAVGRLLETPVELLYSQKKMVPVQQKPIGQFANSPAQWLDLIAYLRRATDEDMLESDTTDRPRTPPAVVGRVDATSVRIDYDESQTMPDAPVVGAEQSPRDQPAGEPAYTAAPVATDQADRIPIRSGSPTACPEHSDAAPDLLHLISATHAGAVALEARCPLQPATQLILDQSGRLHLLRRQDEALHEDLRIALIDLIEARTWVRQHLSLLSLTMRQCRFDLSRKPVLHLFTSESKVAASLVGRVGQYVRFHVLQRIQVGDGTTWVSTDLN